MNVVILHDEVAADARPDEADALVQAASISQALRELGHEPRTLGISLDLEAAASKLAILQPDLVFNLVESLGGHGRLIHVAPGLLEALGVPYTGASAEAQFNTSNKLIAKRLLRGADLPTAEWHTIETLGHRLGEPLAPSDRWIIKSVWEHASVGLDEDSIVEAESDHALRQAIVSRVPALGGEAFAERFIDGREFNLGLLANGEEGTRGDVEVLPPAEIVFEGYDDSKPKVVGYRAKWDEGSYEYHHTPRRYDFPAGDGALLKELTSIARRCWEAFGLRGYARVDFRVDGEGKPWVLEINTNPCLSPDAGFAAALERAGIGYADAVRRIMGDTLDTLRGGASHTSGSAARRGGARA